MRKTNVLFLVLAVSMIVFCGISYAAVAGFINAAQPAAPETGAARTVEEAVRGEGEPLASNTTVVLTNIGLLEKIAAIEQGRLTSVVTLDSAVTASIPADVRDPIGYALNLAAVGGVIITATGDTYSVNESKLKPQLFAASEVLRDPAAFAAIVDAFNPDQVGVILPTSTQEKAAVEALNQVKERVEKVTVNPPVTADTFLSVILEEAVKKGPVGIALGDALESPAVVAARQSRV